MERWCLMCEFFSQMCELNPVCQFDNFTHHSTTHHVWVRKRSDLLLRYYERYSLTFALYFNRKRPNFLCFEERLSSVAAYNRLEIWSAYGFGRIEKNSGSLDLASDHEQKIYGSSISAQNHITLPKKSVYLLICILVLHKIHEMNRNLLYLEYPTKMVIFWQNFWREQILSA